MQRKIFQRYKNPPEARILYSTMNAIESKKKNIATQSNSKFARFLFLKSFGYFAINFSVIVRGRSGAVETVSLSINLISIVFSLPVLLLLHRPNSHSLVCRLGSPEDHLQCDTAGLLVSILLRNDRYIQT